MGIEERIEALEDANDHLVETLKSMGQRAVVSTARLVNERLPARLVIAASVLSHLAAKGMAPDTASLCALAYADKLLAVAEGDTGRGGPTEP